MNELQKKNSNSPLGDGGYYRRHFENLHIPLWLMKDTCWLLQWKLFGMIMIVPTLGVAIAIALMNLKEKDEAFWINLAICFWIFANAYWMCCEFVGHEELKDYAIYPFIAGFISVAVFYARRLMKKGGTKVEDYL